MLLLSILPSFKALCYFPLTEEYVLYYINFIAWVNPTFRSVFVIIRTSLTPKALNKVLAQSEGRKSGQETKAIYLN